MKQVYHKKHGNRSRKPAGFSQWFSDTPEGRILSYFFLHPRDSVHGRELARRTGLSAATAFRALKALVRQGWLSERAERHATLFWVRESPAFKAAKAAFSVARIVDTGLSDQVASDSKGLHAFLLFGSAARGEDGPGSDYDFLLVADSTSVSASRLSERLGRDVNLKVFSMSEWVALARLNPAFYRDVLTYSWVLLGQKPVA